MLLKSIKSVLILLVCYSIYSCGFQNDNKTLNNVTSGNSGEVKEVRQLVEDFLRCPCDTPKCIDCIKLDIARIGLPDAEAREFNYDGTILKYNELITKVYNLQKTTRYKLISSNENELMYKSDLIELDHLEKGLDNIYKNVIYILSYKGGENSHGENSNTFYKK